MKILEHLLLFVFVQYFTPSDFQLYWRYINLHVRIWH